jgi:trans-aconitate methyltransferase
VTLTELGAKWNTDKGTLHSYLPVYEELFAPLRHRPIRLLEIGVASGASVRVWLEWFPRAEVHGIDVAPAPPSDARYVHHRHRQENEEALREYPANHFDVIIDDGSHDPWQQLVTCHGLWESLKSGGLYLVEDVAFEERIAYWTMMPGFRVWKFLKDGRYDDILVMLRKS